MQEGFVLQFIIFKISERKYAKISFYNVAGLECNIQVPDLYPQPSVTLGRFKIRLCSQSN